jgi:hypothetical protein
MVVFKHCIDIPNIDDFGYEGYNEIWIVWNIAYLIVIDSYNHWFCSGILLGFLSIFHDKTHSIAPNIILW